MLSCADWSVAHQVKSAQGGLITTFGIQVAAGAIVVSLTDDDEEECQRVRLHLPPCGESPSDWLAGQRASLQADEVRGGLESIYQPLSEGSTLAEVVGLVAETACPDFLVALKTRLDTHPPSPS